MPMMTCQQPPSNNQILSKNSQAITQQFMAAQQAQQQSSGGGHAQTRLGQNQYYQMSEQNYELMMISQKQRFPLQSSSRQ
jgi:hypothetical protein